MKKPCLNALRVHSITFFVILLGICISPAAARAQRDDVSLANNGRPDGPKIRAGGYLQLFFRLEQVENGDRQAYSGDEAAQVASGFTLNRARIGIDAESEKSGGRILIRLEGGTIGLLDAYGYYRVIGKALELRAGQMKIPSTSEVAVPDEALDFVTRSRFSTETPNWSLSRSISELSPFTTVQTYARDLGVAVKGSAAGFEYFLFVGNGLGANYSIGKADPAGILHTNSFGAFFYGARASCDAVKILGYEGLPVRYLVVGAHVDRNKHENVTYQDDRSVFDFDRFSWSVDLQTMILNRVRIAALFGNGKVDDDLYDTGETEYEYRGGELRGIFAVIPDTLEAGVRYDSYTEHYAVKNGEETKNQLTAGVTYNLKPNLRFQLDYLHRWLVSDLNSDTADDLLIGSAQLMF
jgi:hypothetical protein